MTKNTKKEKLRALKGDPMRHSTMTICGLMLGMSGVWAGAVAEAAPRPTHPDRAIATAQKTFYEASAPGARSLSFSWQKGNATLECRVARAENGVMTYTLQRSQGIDPDAVADLVKGARPRPILVRQGKSLYYFSSISQGLIEVSPEVLAKAARLTARAKLEVDPADLKNAFLGVRYFNRQGENTSRCEQRPVRSPTSWSQIFNKLDGAITSSPGFVRDAITTAPSI